MSVTPEALAQTLLARGRAALEASARQAHAIRGKLADVDQRFRTLGTWRRAWLIGSLAWGRFGQGSDVDLVVEGMKTEEQGSTWATLTDLLDAPVDLLRIEELDPAFAARVRSEGSPLS